MNLCNSCYHAQVRQHKGNQHIVCTSKQNVKNHNKYCRDYLNRERFIQPHMIKPKEFDRYRELG